MEPEGSLPHSKEHAICPCCKPYVSSEGPSFYIYLKSIPVLQHLFHLSLRLPRYCNMCYFKTDGRGFSLHVLTRTDADSLPARLRQCGRVSSGEQCVVTSCVGCKKVCYGFVPEVRCVVWTRFGVLNAV